MEARKDLALLSWGQNVKTWLEHARMAGIKCYISKATDFDLCNLANICQMLAKCPDVKKHGSQFVRDKQYIHEAIIYLNNALQLGGFVNFKVAYTLSSCLNEIQEHRASIEWMKIAMDLAKTSGEPEPLTRIAQYILGLYRAASSKGETSRKYLLSEMQYWISRGNEKYHDLNRSISDLCKYNADDMFDFIDFLLNNNLSNTCTEHSKIMILSCLDALKRWKRGNSWYEDKIEECENRLQRFHYAAVTVEPDNKSTAQYTFPDIVMPFSMDARTHHCKSKYDFFVFHSNVNRDWVHNFLLHQLETHLYDNDTALRGKIFISFKFKMI